ncbi:MAG TPA: ABC transporter substrate-binding protein [Clostridiales bacterium]|jgi:branched-chain amino acid transport system substrate-binding protein|nr:ABC transporter substrate-binding protein [Clostridiales bacterium]
MNKKNTAIDNKHRVNLTRGLLLVLIGLLSIIAVGCTTGAKTQLADPNIIKIGVFEPLTGELAEAAKSELAGIELAHKLYPTVDGKKIELVMADNKSDLDGATAAAEMLVNESVVAVVGSHGNLISIAGGDVFREAEIPAIAATCVNPLVTAGNPYYFRVAPVDSFQGVMAAKYVVNALKQKQVVVMKALGDDWGTALSGKFIEKLKQLTGDETAVVKTVEYKPDAESFQAALQDIAGTGVQTIYLTGQISDSVRIINQARQAGLQFHFIGTDRWHDDQLLSVLETTGDQLVFTSFAEAGAPLTAKTGEFKVAWEEAYGKDLPPDPAAALGFDAYLMVYQALEKQAEAASTQSSRPKLADLISKVKDFQGATGSIQFDENGDPIKPIVFMTIENGEFTYKYTAVPEWGNS